MKPEEIIDIWTRAKKHFEWAHDTKAEIPYSQIMRLCVEYAELKKRGTETELIGADNKTTQHIIEERKAWQSLLTKIKEEV